MSDHIEMEEQLRKLRPLPASERLLRKVEEAMEAPTTSVEEKIVRPSQFQWRRLSLGVGLAAAAAIAFFLYLDQRELSSRPGFGVTQSSPSPHTSASTLPATFLPTGATQVVYHTRDEGLFFPPDSARPVRKVRSATHETLQWRNPVTGASLRVSYPTERVDLIPVSGQ